LRSIIHSKICYQRSIVSTLLPAAGLPATGTGHCFPAELLEQLKEQLPEALFAMLSGTVATYEKQLDTTRSELQYAQLKIQVLEEHLRLRRIAKYGPGSEKLSDLQLEMLEEEPGVSRQEVGAESEREPLPLVGDEKKRKRPHPGRQALPAELPRVEKVIVCTPEQCACGNCGKETVVIGYEVSEVLKVKRAEYYVEVSKREKRACKQCEEQGVEAAPLPARISTRVWLPMRSSSTRWSVSMLTTVLSTARARFCCARPAWTSAGRRCAAG
jgi:transposase